MRCIHGGIGSGVAWRLTGLLALTLALTLAGCPDEDDDDTGVTDDDTGDDDDDGDDDSIPTIPCIDAQASAELDGTLCADQAACGFGDIGSSLYQGFSLASGGDFDGDGLEDLLVGAPGFDLIQDDGRAAVYTAASFEVPVPAPVAVFHGQQPLENVGYRVAFAGDVDGDGLADLLTGARNDADGGEGAGAVYLVHGRGLAGDPTEPETLAADTAIRGEQAFGRVGIGLSGLGDVNGDGTSEVAVAYELFTQNNGFELADDGHVALFYGAPGGLAAELDTSDADVTLEAPLSMSQLGYALDHGDVTGDGVEELLVGAPQGDTSRGRVYVVRGADLTTPGTYAAEDIAVFHTGADVGEELGTAVAFLGDVDGDGIGDLAAGSPDSSLTWPNGGALTVLRGSDAIDAGTAPEVLVVIGSEWDDFLFGGAISRAGDTDGDGLGELWVGGSFAYAGPIMKGGRGYLLHGRDSGWESLVDATDADAGVAGIGVGDNAGTGLAMGDLNGDGVDELLLGSPYRDSTGSDSGQIYLFWGPTR
jgi:FG-GAP repeat